MMKHRVPAVLQAVMSIACVLSSSAAALAQELPIRRGTYVLDSVKCTDAPNAAITVWDGKGFSGAHVSGCTSHVERLPNGNYSVSTACTALGDGTPDPAGASDLYTMTLKLKSSTKFTVTKVNGPELTYRWCSAK